MTRAAKRLGGGRGQGCLAYQIVAGAFVRHSPHLTTYQAGTIFQVAVYFHVLLAVLLTAHVMLLAWRTARSHVQSRGGWVLLALLLVQLALGIGTWIVKYGLPGWAVALVGEWTFVNSQAGAAYSTIITSHVAVGSLILVTALAIALRSGRVAGLRWPQWSMAAVAGSEVAL